MKKVLILPFHLSPELKEQSYLLESLLEECIDQFALVKSIHTFPRSTSLYFHSNPSPSFELREKLGADLILEGSIKKTPGEYVIAARISDLNSDKLLVHSKKSFNPDKWIESLHELLTELLSYFKINSGTNPFVSDIQNEARAHYLKGIYHWHRYNYEEMLLAIESFKKAISIKEDYAQAYSGIADSYTIIGVMGFEDPLESFKHAKKNVQRAIFLNDKRSESYISAAMLNLYFDYDLAKAKQNLDKALKLNKQNANTHHALAVYYSYLKKYDLAEKHSLYAIKKEPLYLPFYTMIIRFKLYQKKFDEAQDYINAALSIEGNAHILLELRGELCLLSGDIESAIEILENCINLNPDNFFSYGLLSIAYSKAKFLDNSLDIENKLDLKKEPGNLALYHFAKAIIYFGRKEFGTFFSYFKKSMNAGLSFAIGAVYFNPLFGEIKNDARYLETLKKLPHLETDVPSAKKRLAVANIEIQSSTKESLVIDPQDICYIESQGNYCFIYWHEHQIVKNQMLRVTMKYIEDLVSDFDYLYRCHKSYIINTLESLSLSGNARGLYLDSPFYRKRIPVSRAKNEEIKTLVSA